MEKSKLSNEKYFNENKVVACATVSIVSLSASVLCFLVGFSQLHKQDLDGALSGNLLIQASTIAAIIAVAFVGFAVLLKVNPSWFKKEE